MSELQADTREAAIQRQVLDYLRLRRIPATRNQAGHVRVGASWLNLGAAGWPDIIACWHGRFLGIEVKRPGEEPSAGQQQVHAELAAAGALILIVHSIEDLEIGLRALLKRPPAPCVAESGGASRTGSRVGGEPVEQYYPKLRRCARRNPQDVVA